VKQIDPMLNKMIMVQMYMQAFTVNCAITFSICYCKAKESQLCPRQNGDETRTHVMLSGAEGEEGSSN